MTDILKDDLSFVEIQFMQVSTSTLPLDAQNEHLPQQSINTIDFYEAAIATDETIATNYWHLGVAYLLAGREEDAQAAWFSPLAIADEIDIDNLTNDLIEILEKSANHQFEKLDLEQAWLLRQHIWTLAPNLLENVLHLIYLANRLDTLTVASIAEWKIDELIQVNTIENTDEVLIERVIGSLITIPSDLSLETIKYCLNGKTLDLGVLIGKLIGTLFQAYNQQGPSPFLAKIVEFCNKIQPNSLGVLQVLSYMYSGIGLYPEAVAAAEQYCQLASKTTERLFGSYQIQRTHFTAGNWQDVDKRINLHRQLLAEFIKESPRNLERSQYQTLIVPSFFLPYTEDNPRINKSLQNQLAAIYQQNVQPTLNEVSVEKPSLKKKTGCLRIGYIGCTLRSHSVGWLSRWLMNYHDRENFQIFLYCLNINQDDNFNNQWFRNKVDVTSYLNGSVDEIISQIRVDEIDILIDLDSLTYDITCLVMAHKPAPVQISWLGWDSPGIPAIDYFIADPYVLPDDAQDYYSEKIWRLPHTYLAVDGFEIGIPTLRREDLDIPADAVVYLSGQSGYKRHPDCVRAQMQIIKAVPNSYFLIKGTSDAATIQNFFGKLAAEVGISLDRLRFLDRDRDEYSHRANLAIADIVLDTFPYNGATTTLETLWMGIPMVTQVGQQFAARNSYTFMLNAGIEEGIAWSQEEYIQWGIKLGLDRELRDKIAGKLRSSRTTAPVWNAKQFTLEMEQAYRDMWAKHQEQQQHDLN
jgi:predicted O-linked N-acetylglucosamine transferase (SPINDLY family)